MKFSIAAVAAIVAIAQAQIPTGANPTQLASILSVLGTALPASLLTQAYGDPGRFSSEIVSSFSAQQTPGWFAALPSDVQSYLRPASVSASASSASSSSSSSTSSRSNSTIVTGTTTSTRAVTVTSGSTTITTSTAVTRTTTGTSTGGAAATNAIGAGIVGAMGLALLAL